MEIKKIFDPKPLGYIQMCLFILIELLLIFDKTFSKFNVIGPFYLYDILLILLTLISGVYILVSKIKLRVWPIQVLIGVASLYLVYSYFYLHSPINYTIRQFAVIVYLFNIYLIFTAFVSIEAQKFNVRFFILLGAAAFALQIGYHLYNLVLTQNYFLNIFNTFNYYSEMGFMALFLFEVYILVYLKQWWKWVLLFIFLMLLITLGHQGSTVILFLIILGTYVFMLVKKYQKILLVTIGVLGLSGLFLFLPEYFLDKNTIWRIVYWKITLKDIFIHYYGVLGHGFGVKFTTQEVLDKMISEVHSPWFEVRPEEQYLSPMHNSFVTIAYHIGFVFMLLIFLPQKNMFRYIFNRTMLNPTREKDFLSLTLIGLIVWSSLHVILELPHSSALFWLVYFSTIYEFNYKPKAVD